MFLVIALAGCGPPEGTRLSGAGVGGVQGWKFVSGKRPSRAEYAALVASCEQGAVRSAQGKPFERGRPLDACLADLGLRRE